MSFTQNFQIGWSRQGGGGQVTTTTNVVGDEEYNLDTTLAAGAVDQLMSATITVAKIQSIFILAAQNGILKTNSSTAPGNTLTLVGMTPSIYYPGGSMTLQFTVNITAFYLTNSNTTQTNEFKIMILLNPY